MSTPAAKRRRIDTASQTLSKPFRSPFKTPFKSPIKGPTTSSTQTPDLSSPNPTTLPTSSTRNATPLAPKSTNSLLDLNRVPTSKLALPPSTPRPGRKKFSSPIATAKINADPEVARLLKEQRELERELREVKEELDRAEQAGKIERDSRKWMLKQEEEGLRVRSGGRGGEDELELDGELVELIEKWRSASRGATEELFGRVRDRVNRMGGPRAWKEAQKQGQEQQNSWDQEEQTNNGDADRDEDDAGDERSGDKRDLYSEYDIDPETENEKSQRAKGLGDTGELPGQEDEFTMAMMLRTLNVDLDIIGYDRQQQRWVD